MQLQNLCLEMQSLEQDKGPRPKACEEVWCIRCKGQGHDKDHCLIFVNYWAGGTNSVETRGTGGAKRNARTLVRDLLGGRKAHNKQLSSITKAYTAPPVAILQFL